MANSNHNVDADIIVETEKPVELEFKDDFEGIDVESLLPVMNVSHKDLMPQQEKQESIVADEQILGLYEEILDGARKDRDSADELLVNFVDMVLNDGDSSSASKEAVVNLMKIKSDVLDKMAKVADLMTRIKLKEKDTFPRYLAAQQNNKVIIEGSKRDMLKQINKVSEEKKK